jgi:two-component system nitrogen regulation response regulator NtrX
MALEVLVVDDEADIRELVAGVLEDEGYAVRSAADSSGALDAIDERRPSLVLLDVWLQGSKLDGLQLLEQIKRRDPTLPVLMISGHGNLDTAVAAIREGAVDFIEKPFKGRPIAAPGRPGDRNRPAETRSRDLAHPARPRRPARRDLSGDQHGASNA